MEKKIQNVAVIGTGTMGAQIAIWVASFNYKVAAFDTNKNSLKMALRYIEVAEKLAVRKSHLSGKDWEEGSKNILFFTDIGKAVKNSDLVIEAVPEDLDVKRNIFKTLDSLTPPHTVFATNSSSIPISKIESATNRPGKCVNIHFYSLVSGLNMADVMGGNSTTSQTIKTVKEWIRSIGCVPLTVKKQIPGFCFNRIWRSVKREALHMWADGFVDFRDIDRGWMIAYGTPSGPFGIMDRVGLDVVYDIEMAYYNESKDPNDFPPRALNEKVNRNELGFKTNHGFYMYPDPEYSNPNFLE